MHAPIATRSSTEALIRELELLDAEGDLTAEMLELYVANQNYIDTIPPWLRWARQRPQRFLHLIEDIEQFVERHIAIPALAEFYRRPELAKLIPRQQRRAVLSCLLSAYPPADNQWVEVLYDADYSTDNIAAIVVDAVKRDTYTITPRQTKSFIGTCFITNALQPVVSGQSLWQLLGASRVLRLLETTADFCPWLIIGGIKSNSDQFVFDKVRLFFADAEGMEVNPLAVANNLYVSAALSLTAPDGVNFYEVRRLPLDLREMILERLQQPWLELLINVALELKPAESFALLERFGRWFEEVDPCKCFIAYQTTLKNSKHKYAPVMLSLLEAGLRRCGYVFGNPTAVHLNSGTVFRIRAGESNYQHNAPFGRDQGIRPIHTVVFDPRAARPREIQESVVYLVEFKVVNPEQVKPEPYPVPRS